MKYKALIFDLDGTTVPSILEGMPSNAVIKAVHRAKSKLKFSSASARSLQHCRNIWKALSLQDPCIVNGGAQIINPKTEEIIWEQYLPKGTISEVLKKSEGYTNTFAVNGLILNSKKEFDKFPKDANIIVAFGVKKDRAESLVQSLSGLPDAAIHILHSWIEGDFWDVHVNHKLATKKHAIERLIEILGVKEEEVIGIGDGNNDIPLFESVGFRVAMGNAVNNLKDKADYITETFDNDGFAKFLEEKIL